MFGECLVTVPYQTWVDSQSRLLVLECSLLLFRVVEWNTSGYLWTECPIGDFYAAHQDNSIIAIVLDRWGVVALVEPFE